MCRCRSQLEWKYAEHECTSSCYVDVLLGFSIAKIVQHEPGFLLVTVSSKGNICRIFMWLSFLRHTLVLLHIVKNYHYVYCALCFQSSQVNLLDFHIQANKSSSELWSRARSGEKTAIWIFLSVKGARWRSWLRHYATSRNVSGSIPEELDFSNWPNPSSRTMALRSTQSITEMSTRNIPGG
jgi:hypothetical protein